MSTTTLNITTMKSTLITTSKVLLLFALFIILGTEVQAGGGKYEKKMAETLQAMGAAESPQALQEVANQFLIVAKAEKKEWLPYYYHAYSHIMANFMLKGQPEQQDLMLDEAKSSIETLLKMAPDNGEVHALNAFHLMARLAVNPQERGQTHSMKTQMAVAHGLAIDAKNPRLRYVKISTDFGTARFFGSGGEKHCAAAQDLAAEWDNFTPESPLHPTWGKNLVARMIQQNCGSEK
ncbi:MAG: hypothetical protein AAGN35_02585 [Bacteroidota bacterium]